MKKLFIITLCPIFYSCGNDTDDTLEFIANPLIDTSWYALTPEEKPQVCPTEYHFTKDILTTIIKKNTTNNLCSDSLRNTYSYRITGNKILVHHAPNIQQEWLFLRRENKLEIKKDSITEYFIQNIK